MKTRRLALAVVAWSFAVGVLSLSAAAATRPNAGTTGGVGFSSLTGPTGAPFFGSTEGDFAVTPTSGAWFQSLIYGNPGPSIFAGPINTPTPAVLQVTDSANLFTFASLDYSSNNGESTYDIQGFLGATLQFHETGTLLASFSPFHFNTLSSADSTTEIDGLLIQVLSGAGVTSVNIDNITVVTVPEPGALALAFLALAGFSLRRRTSNG